MAAQKAQRSGLHVLKMISGMEAWLQSSESSGIRPSRSEFLIYDFRNGNPGINMNKPGLI
jgi:hypothetical protein